MSICHCNISKNINPRRVCEINGIDFSNSIADAARDEGRPEELLATVKERWNKEENRLAEMRFSRKADLLLYLFQLL